MLYGMLLTTFALALFTQVSASSYPIKPKNTVYYAGEAVWTTWIDDGSYALLNDMDWITIQLVTDCDTCLAALATNVSPLVKFRHLKIPRRPAYDDSTFTPHYLTDAPYKKTTYSAHFTTAVRVNSIPHSPLPLGSKFKFLSSITGLVSSQAALLTTSQHSSPSLPSASEAESSNQPTSSGTPPFLPNNIGRTNGPSGERKTSATDLVNTERLKFRLVFILWPAVLGVTLDL